MTEADDFELPDDAGEYAAGLTAILQHFEPGWVRWIECERGWYPLITRLHADLLEVAPEYVIQQVKEKFGGLRFYADVQPVSADEEVAPEIQERFEELIREAENQSTRTCELCGNDGEPWRTGMWVKTLCQGCRGSQDG